MEPEEYLEKRYKSAVTRLFKDFIGILEDLQEDHRLNFDKLYKHMPKDVDLIEMADYFGDDKFEWLRKKTLDLGNDCIRSFSSDTNQLNITFKFK